MTNWVKIKPSELGEEHVGLLFKSEEDHSGYGNPAFEGRLIGIEEDGGWNDANTYCVRYFDTKGNYDDYWYVREGSTTMYIESGKEPEPEGAYIEQLDLTVLLYDEYQKHTLSVQRTTIKRCACGHIYPAVGAEHLYVKQHLAEVTVELIRRITNGAS